MAPHREVKREGRPWGRVSRRERRAGMGIGGCTRPTRLFGENLKLLYILSRDIDIDV